MDMNSWNGHIGKNTNKVEKYIKLIVEELKKYHPKRIILFGSRARGNFKKNSDIDIAIDVKVNFREKRKLIEKVDRLSGLYSVDLIFLPEIDNKFRKKILEEGVLLYEKS